MTTDTSGRRISALRQDFLAYRIACPFCGTAVGPREVTREHLDVPPDPPYAASVRCLNCIQGFEVLFEAS